MQQRQQRPPRPRGRRRSQKQHRHRHHQLVTLSLTVVFVVVAIAVMKMEGRQSNIRLHVVLRKEEEEEEIFSAHQDHRDKVQQYTSNSGRNSTSRSTENSTIGTSRGGGISTTADTSSTIIRETPGSSSKKKDGIFVVGVGRSGTSLLTGLLASSSAVAGYSTLGKLKDGSEYNSKGYFGLESLTRQNMKWLREIGKIRDHNDFTSKNVRNFFNTSSSNPEMFELSQDGQETIQLIQNSSNIPWVLKDPRLCFTLPIWLSKINDNNNNSSNKDISIDEPPLPPQQLAHQNNAAAVVFTFRHPLEVAKSMKKRNPRKKQSIKRGLYTWLNMNKLAITNLHRTKVCFVTTSMDSIMLNPQLEIRRIQQEMTVKCHVAEPIPPSLSSKNSNNLTNSTTTLDNDGDGFIDPTLQHHHHHQQQNNDDGDDDFVQLCTTPISTTSATTSNNNTTMMTTNDETHKGSINNNINITTTTTTTKEEELYLASIKIFCDMKSGNAFDPHYEWIIPSWK